jgi:eukaryotic-like serine/threonine-protein kinase
LANLMALESPDAAGERPTHDKSQAMSALLLELATMPRRSEDWERVLRPGETVGRFELVSEIGRGGFGIVYEARDRELGRSVAFKAVRPGRGLDAGAGELLLREAEAIARLSHPNLVTLHDVGRCEQGPYLVLELLRGATLGERLQAGPLPVCEALRIGVDVARGLAHAHAAGVTHRDLKPSNVFLCTAGHVKVLDFGMAHAFGRQRILGGTPAYMAPEQWQDASEDERTDVFALGVMLYQMLAGDVPMPEGGKSLERGPAPRVSVPTCPALGELVARMLERDPADRPRDASEVLAALVAFRDALRGAEDTTARFVLPPVRRRRSWPWLAVAGVVLVAAAAGWALWPRTPPAPAAPSVAVLPFTALSADPDDASMAAGIHAELITQLTQIGGVRVIGRSSVQGYDRPGQRDLRAIARQLGVKAVVEGTVQRDGDRLRIQAHLVDPPTGEQRWAERFDRRIDDLFALQSQVALEITRALGAELTVTERGRVERPPTRDPVAHQMYLRALYFWGRSSDDLDRARAQELLAGAVTRDPGFALAHAWMAVLDTELANSGITGYPFEPTCARARTHAARALELDADLPQAHGAVAEVRWACEGDSRGALAEYEIQAREAPGDGVARVNVGFTRMALGQWRTAADDLRAAMELDPRSYFVAMLVADRMIQLRRFDEAERACQRAQELSPGDVRAPTTCAMIPFWRSGDVGPARAALDAMVQQWSASTLTVASAVDLLYLLPERTLALAEAGRLPDPISDHDPFIPRALLTGAAHHALGQDEKARADFASVVEALEANVAAMRRQKDEAALAIQMLWLARAHAGLGRGDEGLREAQEALTHIKDVAMRTSAVADVAETALVAGRKDEAVRLLAEVLDSPGGTVTAASLRSHPALADLRGYAPFEALVTARLAGR